MKGGSHRRAAALCLGLASTPAWAGPGDLDGPEPQAWLGHSRVGSVRQLPILGALRTRTDTWVLARVIQDGDRLLIEQIPCAMEIKPVAGVRVGMTEAAVRALPSASFVLQAEGEAWTGLPWTSGWGEEDLDQDGEPGVSVQVRSALCGGELAVASQTLSTAQARFDGEELSGSLQVEVQQRILGAHGACLRAVAQDSVDRMQGSFRYAPAPPGARCEDLPRAAWPIAD